MPVLRRRAKKILRNKYGKAIKLSDVDKIWRQYVEYGIKKPLLRVGKVNIGSSLVIEIVGKRIIDDPKAYNLLVNGLNVGRKGNIKKSVVFDGNRPGVKYKIVLSDSNYKRGGLIFKADRKLSNDVHKELVNTKTYYRIENVSK